MECDCEQPLGEPLRSVAYDVASGRARGLLGRQDREVSIRARDPVDGSLPASGALVLRVCLHARRMLSGMPFGLTTPGGQPVGYSLDPIATPDVVGARSDGPSTTVALVCSRQAHARSHDLRSVGPSHFCGVLPWSSVLECPPGGVVSSGGPVRRGAVARRFSPKAKTCWSGGKRTGPAALSGRRRPAGQRGSPPAMTSPLHSRPATPGVNTGQRVLTPGALGLGAPL